MNDNFESLNDKIPDFTSALTQRLADKKYADAPDKWIDPYKLMLKRKNEAEGGEIDTSPVVKWPEKDVKTLQDYCMKMGIVGYNNGNVPPLVALNILKKQLGDYVDIPIEDRIPEGYEKVGTISPYNSNFPYIEAMRKKQIITNSFPKKHII